MGRDISPLLEIYDAFGWIPTIRGALSLDLMGDSANMWGDVDRHAVAFVNFDGFSSERFIAATTLQNVSDTKYGKDYVRTFRYFFYGSIHNSSDSNDFLKNLPSKVREGEKIKEIEALVKEEGVLLGKLVIVVEETYSLSDLEIRIINQIKDLVSARRQYDGKFSVEAVSLKSLDAMRGDMKTGWLSLKHDIDHLKFEDKIQFTFDVFLTRDGITLLRDCSDDRSKATYFEAGTSNDYTQCVPIHRMFKTAMNFMKFLFHKNYHHEEEHDTFLPASNLHPYHSSRNFSKVLKHQTDAFLNPLMKMRRNEYRQLSVDPVGILCYAKSFVYVCRDKCLIPEDEARRQLDHIALQEQEMGHAMRYSKSLLTSLATQRNLFFILTTVLAFAVAVLKILESALHLSSDSGVVKLSWVYTALMVMAVCAVGYILFEISSYFASKREFHRSRLRKWKNRIRTFLFMRDSDLRNSKLSWQLRMYMWIQDRWFELSQSKDDSLRGKQLKVWAIVILWLAVLIFSIYLIAKQLP